MADYLTYLDFDLAIEAVTAAALPVAAAAVTYRARVLHSPAGQAAHEFTLPFNAVELENYILKMAHPRRTVRSLNTTEGQTAREFGERLFIAVFQGDVRDALRRSLDAADAKAKHGLRIRLRLADAPELLDIPWEYLYDPTLRRFFCHSVSTPLVRYPQQPRPVVPLTVTPPLQLLVMISNPSDVAVLDVEDEWGKTAGALEPLVDQGLIQLTRLERATLATLQRQLRQGNYHIFHFVGHGGIDRRSGERVLYLEDEVGHAHPVGGDHLGTLLRDHRSLRLALLNACEGARADASDPFAGVAQHLVYQGIPAIIAMQFEITDSAAITLAKEFYEALADGYPVEAALAEARKAIFVMGNDVEWGTPVLYSRANNGLLFRVDASAPPTDVNLPGRSNAAPHNTKEPAAPSQKTAADPPIHAAPTGPVVRDEERIATEKAAAERVAKRIFQDEAGKAERKPAGHVIDSARNQPVSHNRGWWRVLLVIVCVILVGYLSLVGLNSYQQNQRNSAATATQQAKYAAATAQAPTAHATATAIAQSVATAMLQNAPELRPLLDRFGMQFVPIPAGEFLMGSPDGVGDSDEHPQFTMTTDAYWIGLTEVTNAQYGYFMNANGYANKDWWTEAGWAWRTENNISAPGYWNDSKWNGANQPVVGISWYEATAYTTWLAAETGLAIRLPTEAEWEKAARGISGQTYPWGDTWPTAQLLNYKSNVGYTTDVGSYPSGASPYGALDMGGNVWEWTATQWVDNYENYIEIMYSITEGDGLRTLRGGSWYFYIDAVRTANRDKNNPSSRDIVKGFRLAFAPGG